MGGRGSSSGVAKGRNARMGDFLTPDADVIPALDKSLIDRANAAGTVVDFGDATSRQYVKDVQQITSLELSDNKKKEAIQELHRLTTQQLLAESKKISQYSMGVGPARFDNKRVQSSSQKAVDARQTVRSFMENLKKKSDRNKQQNHEKKIDAAFRTAMEQGKLTVTIDGKEYFRTTKGSGTWREGSLTDYKAQKKFEKTQKSLPFTKKKSWSQLSKEEKLKYY